MGFIWMSICMEPQRVVYLVPAKLSKHKILTNIPGVNPLNMSISLRISQMSRLFYIKKTHPSSRMERYPVWQQPIIPSPSIVSTRCTPQTLSFRSRVLKVRDALTTTLAVQDSPLPIHNILKCSTTPSPN